MRTLPTQRLAGGQSSPAPDIQTGYFPLCRRPALLHCKRMAASEGDYQ